jgi:hypothetical protein
MPAQDKPEFKHFLPLPKPAHLVSASDTSAVAGLGCKLSQCMLAQVYIKPTVAVVAGKASRSSVGLKMTAGDNQLERYVIEFYSRKI